MISCFESEIMPSPMLHSSVGEGREGTAFSVLTTAWKKKKKTEPQGEAYY